MSCPTPPDIAQHNREIHENAERWKNKPLLRGIYANFYAQIARRIQRQQPGLIVELGSGIGNLKQAIPECIATDLFENPWLDQVENAYSLSFKDGSVSNLIIFDVWHHLQYPGVAMREFNRVLKPQGRLIILDPAMGLMGRLIYGLFHHEPLGMNDPIEWDPPAGLKIEDFPYFAAQARAWRMFRPTALPPQMAGWRKEEVVFWSSLDYLASGGFRGPQAYPLAAWPLVRGIDKILSLCPWLFAARMLVVLSKQPVRP